MRSCSSGWATSTRCSTKTPSSRHARSSSHSPPARRMPTEARVPMCGVPFHAVDGYIARLVKKGFRVAICDQVEDPRKAKGIVKREVVRVVSPGTLTDSNYLDAREPAFLVALAPAAEHGTRHGRHRGRGAAGPLDGRIHDRGVYRPRRHAGAGRRARRAEAAGDCRAGIPWRRRIHDAERVRRLAQCRASGSADHAGRRLGVRARGGAPRASRSAARRRAGRIRARSASLRRLGRGRARALSAGDPESRSRARPRRRAIASAPMRC